MRRTALAMMFALWGGLGASGVYAQDAGATARARALFSEAIELADSGDWERAVHRFRSALELRDAPTIRYNLASSLAQLGRLCSAVDELDAVIASPETTDDLREQATALRATVAPRIGRLRVDIAGRGEGTHVTVDGEPWEHVGALAPSNPGIVVVRLWRGDDELDREEIDLADGGEASVILRTSTADVDLSPEAAASSSANASSEGGDDGLWIGLTIGGGAVVVVTAVVIISVVLASESQSPSVSMGDFDPPVLGID